jgi:hypothetical protein
VDPQQLRRIPHILDEQENRAVRGIPLWDGRAGRRAATVIAESLVSRGRRSCTDVPLRTVGQTMTAEGDTE